MTGWNARSHCRAEEERAQEERNVHPASCPRAQKVDGPPSERLVADDAQIQQERARNQDRRPPHSGTDPETGTWPPNSTQNHCTDHGEMHASHSASGQPR